MVDYRSEVLSYAMLSGFRLRLLKFESYPSFGAHEERF